MGKHTTKEEAEVAAKELEAKLVVDGQKPEWLKKVYLDTDDHGYYLNVKITKGFADQVPRVVGRCKICILNVG